MRQTKSLALIAACAALLLGVPAAATATPYTWGQEVTECNSTSCYPDGTTRGVYVSGQAEDYDDPGYAWEIQNLALNPRDLGYEGF